MLRWLSCCGREPWPALAVFASRDRESRPRARRLCVASRSSSSAETRRLCVAIEIRGRGPCHPRVAFALPPPRPRAVAEPHASAANSRPCCVTVRCLRAVAEPAAKTRRRLSVASPRADWPTRTRQKGTRVSACLRKRNAVWFPARHARSALFFLFAQQFLGNAVANGKIFDVRCSEARERRKPRRIDVAEKKKKVRASRAHNAGLGRIRSSGTRDRGCHRHDPGIGARRKRREDAVASHRRRRRRERIVRRPGAGNTENPVRRRDVRFRRAASVRAVGAKRQIGERTESAR